MKRWYSGTISMDAKYFRDGSYLFSNRLYHPSDKKKHTTFLFLHPKAYVIKSTENLEEMVRFLRDWYHEHPFTGYARPHKQLNALLKIIEVKGPNE